MPTLTNSLSLQTQLIVDRQARGIDRLDEVWDGQYVMAPLANNEHQLIATRLSRILGNLIDAPGLGLVQTGANVSDQATDWAKNYRVPDVLVLLNGTRAEDRDTHWYCDPDPTHAAAGPEFAVEIVSPFDRSREKLDFYSRIRVRELLLIERDPWQLELFCLSAGQLISTIVVTATNGAIIESQIVPIQLQLNVAAKRPRIMVSDGDGIIWTI